MSLIEGLRASGKGSASMTVPTLTSTFSKSSKLISGNQGSFLSSDDAGVSLRASSSISWVLVNFVVLVSVLSAQTSPRFDDRP
jgi:hypothetical protein